VTSQKLEAWVTKFKSEMKREPTNYAITSYNAVLVIADAIGRTASGNKPITRSNLRDAIQATKISSIQGPIAFDANGDILTRTVSIYQWRDGEIKYVGVAPEK
jgi:branched-chain amino acid transport system substrate-binding protein